MCMCMYPGEGGGEVWELGDGLEGWGLLRGGEGYVQSTEARVALGCELLDMDAGI